MKEHVTPKQVAQAIGVSEASLKRWCDRGILPSTRTAGGHRRIPVAGVVQWLRDSGHPLVRPELLGLPSNTGAPEASIERSVELFREALEAGDEQRGRQVIFNLYLARHSLVDICDKVMAEAFHALGHQWQHGQIEVYQERRGCEICMQILHELRGVQSPLAVDAPHAIGGTLEYDPYTLPNAMVEIVLREAGWRAESHGTCNPAATIAAAVRERCPRLLWLSFSTYSTEQALVADYQAVWQAAAELGIPVVVGGRALTAEIRQQMNYSAHCDTLRHLVAFVRTLEHAPKSRLEDSDH